MGIILLYTTIVVRSRIRLMRERDPFIRLAGTGLALPGTPPGADPVWHLYVVQSPERDRLAARLAEAGVETLIHYPIPPHRQAAYGDLGLGPGALAVAERLAARVLSLPIGPHLAEAEQDRAIAAIRAACG